MLAASLVLAVGGPTRADCPAQGSEPVTVAAVDAMLELRLGDGRLVRLAGLDPVLATPGDPHRAEAARARLASVVAGRGVTFTALTSAPDRWGRIAGMVFAADSGPGGLASAALKTGLGRYRPILLKNSLVVRRQVAVEVEGLSSRGCRLPLRLASILALG